MKTRRRSLAVASLLVVAGCARSSPVTKPEAASPSPAPTQTTTTTTTTTTTGSCVEQYSLENLKKRDFAFDGTVQDIKKGTEDQPDRITFDVKQWYEGGQGTSAELKAYGFTAITSAGGSPHAVGQRLLVAGDEDFVWECGFTQPYDASVAADWENARRP